MGAAEGAAAAFLLEFGKDLKAIEAAFKTWLATL
jgi:hypothetical protein